MKAAVQDTYGPVDVLELREIDQPVPKDNEVLVRVHAAGVDPGVWHLMTGLPYLVRVMGYGLRTPKLGIRGRDVAGRVAAVGTNVTQVQAGEEVFGIGEGSFAEYVCARADKLAPKPANLTFEQAAAVPISGLTALQGLRDAGGVQPGQRVLIIGAAGGVGSFAVQLAKAFGAAVTGVCSTTKVDLVRSLGAEEVIDYTREDFADGARRWDLIVDTAGRRSLAHLRRALAPRGTLVIVGGEGGGRWLGGFDRQILRAPILSRFVRQQLRPFISKERSTRCTCTWATRPAWTLPWSAPIIPTGSTGSSFARRSATSASLFMVTRPITASPTPLGASPCRGLPPGRRSSTVGGSTRPR